MDSIIPKIIVLAVVIVAVIIGFKVHSVIKAESEKPTKTFYDVAAEDKDKLNAAPSKKDFELGNPPPLEPEASTPTVQPEPAADEPLVLYFREMSEIEKIEAEKLLGTAVPGRSIGRLPMTGYNLAVESSRQIMARWPGTIYDYRARRILRDIPERHRTRYRITTDELDLSRFKKQLPGTIAETIKE